MLFNNQVIPRQHFLGKPAHEVGEDKQHLWSHKLQGLVKIVEESRAETFSIIQSLY